MNGPPIITDILGYLQQFTDYPLARNAKGGRPICREDYDWTSIQLFVNLGGGVTSDPVSAEALYNGPKNFHSLLFGIQAHIGSNDLSDEALSVPNVGNPTIADRERMVAMNTKIDLENSDKQGGSKIFHNGSKRLHALLKGIWLPLPIVVANADTFKLSAAFVDADLAGPASGDWDVGVDLWILQVRSGT